MPHVVVDVPRDHKFEGNTAVLKELLNVWLRDAVRAAAGNAAMARTAKFWLQVLIIRTASD